mmetsp:Transcript_6068/g.27201  ORF Transcript_6068/g.27201 Transcript_6068/m.27201 type:complete len:620 (+) Transcript_6068:3031-4890(+)
MHVLLVRVEAHQARGSGAERVEALEAVLHAALHAPAGEVAQTAVEDHARVLHPVHVNHGRACGARGDNRLAERVGAAEMRVGAVGAPSGVPPAGGLHPAQDAAGDGAQRAHARICRPVLSNLDAVDAALAEPLALGHLREAVAGKVHLNVAAVAHDDAVVLDVPEIRVRLAADVAHVVVSSRPKGGALTLRSSRQSRLLARLLDHAHALLRPGHHRLVVLGLPILLGEDVVHLVVVDGDDLGERGRTSAAGHGTPVGGAGPERLFKRIHLLPRQLHAVLVPDVLLHGSEVLERALVAVGAGYGHLIRGRDRSAVKDGLVLQLHPFNLGRGPAHLLIPGSFAEIQLLDLTLSLLVLLVLLLPGSLAVLLILRQIRFLGRVGHLSVLGLGGRACVVWIWVGGIRLFLTLLRRWSVFFAAVLLVLGLVVEGGHAGDGVQLDHPRLPPGAVLRPEDVDASPHERHVDGVLRGQHLASASLVLAGSSRGWGHGVGRVGSAVDRIRGAIFLDLAGNVRLFIGFDRRFARGALIGPQGLGNRGGGGRQFGLWLRVGSASVGIRPRSRVIGGGLWGRRADRPVRPILAAHRRLPRLLEKSGHRFAAHVPALVRAVCGWKSSRGGHAF